jgi:nicotinamidase-related amidase
MYAHEKFGLMGGAVLMLALTCGAAAPVLELHTRARQVDADDPLGIRIVSKTVQWNPKKTAVIVCDMWDEHWCRGATARVAEMAPRMNDVLVELRRRGVLVVHAPSDTMEFYRDAPQRIETLAAPAVEMPVPLKRWCGLDAQREAALPIDDADGGCDTPGDSPRRAWKRQIDTLRIEPGDAIGDGFEVVHRLQQRGIENVIIMGVHTNMCVLGRPFGIRQLMYQGKNVLLMRDMTDAMYNPASRPKISHFGGTDRVVAHIEQHWCPTITSADVLGGAPFRFKGDDRPRVVALVNEDEYEAEQSLSDFAARLERQFDFGCTVLNGRGKFSIEGIEAIEKADLMMLYVRRRPLPKEQLDAIRAHLDAGRPLVALRTASHAFAVRGAAPTGIEQWPTFDRDVLGCEYRNHAGNALGTAVSPRAGAEKHALLANVAPLAWTSRGSLYHSTLVDDGATVLLEGRAGDFVEPVAWTRQYKKARVYYTSLGHPADFAEPAFRQLMINAVHWALDRPVAPKGE